MANDTDMETSTVAIRRSALRKARIAAAFLEVSITEFVTDAVMRAADEQLSKSRIPQRQACEAVGA